MLLCYLVMMWGKVRKSDQNYIYHFTHGNSLWIRTILITLISIIMRLFTRLLTSVITKGIDERSFLMIKPCAVQRGLVGDIVKRFEIKGFHLVGLKLMNATQEILEVHYKDLKDKPFFPELVGYMNSGPVVCMVWEGLNVVKTGRQMLGSTNPADSDPGTIRGDYSIQVGRNIIHGSDSVEAAKREIDLWFKPSELVDWKPSEIRWVYE